MKTKKFTTSQLTILGLMAGILFSDGVYATGIPEHWTTGSNF